MQSVLNKKVVFSGNFFATGLVFDGFLAPRSRFFEKVNGLGVLGSREYLSFFFGNFFCATGLVFERFLAPRSRFFEKVNGLTVNMAKSSLFGVGVSKEEVRIMSLVLGCKDSSFPTTFLGVPIARRMNRLTDWNPMLEKIKKRLADWKVRTLSIGGRLTLTKSVLGSMGSYWLGIFKAPKTVIREIESIQRKFLWGITGKNRGISWVKWEDVCKNKEDGGLGVGNIEDYNRAMMAKWLWRRGLVMGKNIDSIHGGNWFSNPEMMTNSYPCVWKDIVQCSADMEDEDTKRSWTFGPMHGGDEIFKTKFPRLYNLETEKGAKVVHELPETGNSWKWRRPVREGREKEELQNLQRHIGAKFLNSDRDNWWIPEAPGGMYTVKWYRHVMEKKDQEEEIYNYRWDRSIPIKINILNWRITRGRVPVRTVLAKMGINSLSQFCPFCENDPETVEHVFLGCFVVQELWKFIGAWWNIGIPDFHEMGDVFKWVGKTSRSSIIRRRIFIVISAIFKTVWDHRNGAIFDNKNTSVNILCQKIQEVSFNWQESRNKKDKIDWSLWKSKPYVKILMTSYIITVLHSTYLLRLEHPCPMPLPLYLEYMTQQSMLDDNV
ncbi:hypothetical protein LXL04_003655 [Taraxacum kok-saghyz]